MVLTRPRMDFCRRSRRYSALAEFDVDDSGFFESEPGTSTSSAAEAGTLGLDEPPRNTLANCRRSRSRNTETVSGRSTQFLISLSRTSCVEASGTDIESRVCTHERVDLNSRKFLTKFNAARRSTYSTFCIHFTLIDTYYIHISPIRDDRAIAPVSDSYGPVRFCLSLKSNMRCSLSKTSWSNAAQAVRYRDLYGS